MSYIKPKHYTLKRLDLITHENKSISIQNILDSLTFTEDIFSNFIHGSLVIADSNDLHQLAPIVGEEIIYFVYTTDDDVAKEISLKFRVYRLETSDDKYKDRLSHTMYFCSEEAFEDSNITISKSYKNKSMKFMIEDAFAQLNSNKKFQIDNMSGVFHIISPNWTPFQLINYCTSIARPRNYSGSMVLFYETSAGYNFKHLEVLFSQPAIAEWATNDSKTKLKASSDDEITPSNQITSYKILKNSVDTLKSMSEGLYSNATISYDNVTKEYKIFGYDYKKNFKDNKHLADFKLMSDNFPYSNINQRLTYIPTTTYRYDSDYFKSKMGNAVFSEKKEQVMPYRTSMLSQISAKQIELEVAGDTRLVAGKIIKITLPNVTALADKQEETHRYNRKKVLITSVVNKFTQKSHNMILRVADDAYTQDMLADPLFDKGINNV